MQLRDAPLVHVLAEVVFTTPPGFIGHRADFHARFHQDGFSRFIEGELQRVSVGAGSPVPTIQTIPRWEFLNPESTTGFVVTPTTVMFQTTSYRSFAPFLAELQRGLAILREVSEVASVVRVGLRYVDLVQKREGEEFRDYVHPGLLGCPFGDLKDTPIGARKVQTESVCETDVGFLAVRSRLLPAGEIVPADLQGLGLRYPSRVRMDVESLAIDFDHFTEGSPRFEVEPLIKTVRDLHRALRLAFDATITPFAIEQWGPWIEGEGE